MNPSSARGFVGAALFAVLLSAVLVKLMEAVMPPFVSETAYYLVCSGSLVFLLMHKFRGRMSPHGSHLLLVTVLFFYAPYAGTLAVAKLWSMTGLHGWQHWPWVAYSSASMLVHRQWNLHFLDRRPTRQGFG